MNTNQLNIREIRNDAILMHDGTLAAVLKMRIPDYLHKSKEEQMRMVVGYRIWLMSINQNIQIIGRTVNDDVEEKISILQRKVVEKLRQKKFYKKSLLDLKRFCNWMRKYAKENAPSMRVYYITIPLVPHYPKEKERKKMPRANAHLAKLADQVNRSIELLAKAGLMAKRMTDKELINLYSSFYSFSFYNKEGYYDTIESCVNKWTQGEA